MNTFKAIKKMSEKPYSKHRKNCNQETSKSRLWFMRVCTGFLQLLCDNFDLAQRILSFLRLSDSGQVKGKERERAKQCRLRGM